MNTQISNESPKIFFSNDRLVTTSQAVADYFDKQHKHVLEKIRSLDCSPEFTSANFSAHVENQLVGIAEREIRYYEITKDGFMFLVMGFTGKKAARLKEAYIAKFNHMEAELHSHQLPPVQSSEIHAFCDDHANRTEIIYYQNFRPVFCRTLREGEVVISHESMLEWLRSRGMIILKREELSHLTLSDLMVMAG